MFSQPATEPKAKPTMFQSGKTTFSKTTKAPPALTPSGPALNKRQQVLQKQVRGMLPSFLQQMENICLQSFSSNKATQIVCTQLQEEKFYAWLCRS